jgi:hypothetical protein
MSERREYCIILVVVISLLFVALAFDGPPPRWPAQDSAPVDAERSRTV